MSRFTEIFAHVFQLSSGRWQTNPQADTCGFPFFGEVVDDESVGGPMERAVLSLVLAQLEGT